MQFTTTLLLLLGAVSAVSATQGLTADQKAVADAKSQALVKKLFPKGKPSSRPVQQPGESKGQFACNLCAWGCGDGPGGWNCDCCYPDGSCAGLGC